MDQTQANRETVKKDCGFFNPHQWTKWEQFKTPWHVPNQVPPPGAHFTKTFQKRSCVKCGKEQREEI